MSKSQDFIITDINEPNMRDMMDETGDILTFKLSNINVCFANALRRTILSDIDVCCILSEHHETNQVHIETNNGRLHNEILKHRLSCIPVHVDKDMESFCKDNILEVECHNDSTVMYIVTTNDFHVKNKSSGEQIIDSDKIFPPNGITNDHIDFSRLRPKISDTIPGESLKFRAEFSISNASENSMYNVVSKCSYSNTIDKNEAEKVWGELKRELKAKNFTEEAIDFEKKNFYFLDAQRCFKKDSFDFIIQSIGIFENRQICKYACLKLIDKFHNIISLRDGLTILPSESTVLNSHDIILYDEDYTIGKILEFILYTNFYHNKPILSFCGFKKFHPHDTKCTIRIAFYKHHEHNDIYNLFEVSSLHAISILNQIYQFFD
jgi:DNA-directed RNA polymerase alpha subunit